MVCGRCQKNRASVHVTEVVNGQKKEAHLCDECANAAGVKLKFNFSISDLLGNLVEPAAKTAKSTEPVLKCPQCGITYTEFKAKARLGCAGDYEVFKQGLLMLLEKIHNSTQHVGKIPTTVESVVKKETELVSLKRELDKVVKSEDFEKAAQIRDRIRILETELKSTP